MPCRAQRNTARHAGGLNYDLLFRRSARLLSEGGVVSIVIPSEVERAAEDAAWMQGLYPQRRTRVYTKAGKPARRVLVAYSRRLGPVAEDTLYIHQAGGDYSDDYRRLTGEFYLKF